MNDRELLEAAVAAIAGAAPAASQRRVDTGYRPTLAKRNTALQREIAEHNEAVERRKAEKKARRTR